VSDGVATGGSLSDFRLHEIDASSAAIATHVSTGTRLDMDIFG